VEEAREGRREGEGERKTREGGEEERRRRKKVYSKLTQ